MSYTIDGVVYSSYEAYQRAKRERKERKASRQVDQLRSEMSRVQNQLAATREQYAAASGQYEEQVRANQRMGAQLNELQQLQNRLREAQAQAARDAQQMKQELRSEIDNVRCRVDVTETQLAQLENELDTFQQNVSQQFDAVQQELTTGFELAHARREELRQELRAEVNRVDQKVEHDRRERAQQSQTELTEARQAIADALNRVDSARQHSESLGLQIEISRTDDSISAAEALIKQGRSSAALSSASDARMGACTLTREVVRRQAEMDVARDHAQGRLANIVQLVSNEVARKYYALEIERLESDARRLEDRFAESCRRYPALEVDIREHERALAPLEHRALEIAAEAAETRQLCMDRDARVKTIVRELTREFGPVWQDGTSIGLANPRDLKSPVVAELDFGGGKVDIAFPMEPDQPVDVDGYRHESNQTCGVFMNNVLRVLGENMVILDAEIDTGNPQQSSRGNESRVVRER